VEGKVDKRDIYGGAGPRDLPAYPLLEVARYLRIPAGTLRAWVAGQYYWVREDRKVFQPLIDPPNGGDSRPILLSFNNVVEAHVLDGLRREHQVSLQRVRAAVRTIRRLFPEGRHPLAEHDLLTSPTGLDVFLDRYTELIDLTRDGQVAMRRVLEAHLRRVDRDANGVAIRLYPFLRKRSPERGHGVTAFEEPRAIVMDPTISFGRPVIAGTGIPTSIVADRYYAGESMDELARDYDRPRQEIEEAIRCELRPAA
jgi:uncharacterized protein (DUF433 family)